MENIFITKQTNPINGKITYVSKYDWTGFWKPIHNFLNNPIDYEKDYREWVIQWRAYEKELVAAIRFLRKMRKEATTTNESNGYQYEKIKLRVEARRFYKAREDRKINYKESLKNLNCAKFEI